MLDHVRVLRHAAIASFMDFSAFYTWRTWAFTWLARLLVQVCFFAMVGRLLGGQEQVDRLLIGNAVAIVAIDSAVVILLAVGERRSGTLALMAAAPASHLFVYLGRGLAHLLSGVVISSIAFSVLPLLFGVAVPVTTTLVVLPMIALTGIACYAYGTFIASLVLGFPAARWLVLNLSYLVLMAFCGVNVPVEFWPRWVQAVVTVLPLSHGLAAIREVVADGSVPAIMADLAGELGVAVLWFTLASVGFRRMVTRGRRDGTIEFGA